MIFAFLASSEAILGDFGSEDHRGTPAFPGRVVTLIEKSFWENLVDAHSEDDGIVWGVVYRIPDKHWSKAKENLDIREVQGYSLHETDFHPFIGQKSKPFKCLVYIGTPENPHFVGPETPEIIANRILRSQGPSGTNRDYLFSLNNTLLEICPGIRDAHVQDLADRVKGLAEKEGTQFRSQEGSIQSQQRQTSEHTQSFGQQEEVEKG